MSITLKQFLAGLSLTLLLVSCTEEPQEAKQFELLDSERTGISFINEVTSTPDFNILEFLYFYNGGGVSVGDINKDGLDDMFFTSNQAPNKLYLNKGGFKFEDITEVAGVSGNSNWSTGSTMADVNGDGLLDIYVSHVGNYKVAKGKNELYINNGDGTFTESAAAFGLDYVGFSTQAAFFDYDKDGDLDMYLLNHAVKNAEVFKPSVNRKKADNHGDKIFKSLIAQGENRFEDATAETGIYSSNLGFGLGLAISDVNNDNWPDIYISNDFTENDYLYINNQDGTFSEELGSRIQHTSRYSMGNVVADLNNDMAVDIITTDMLPSDPKIWRKSLGEDKVEVYDTKLRFGYDDQYVRNTLQMNLGNGQFSDISLITESFATDWSWSPLIFDMDNDGLQDLHISNGIYKRPNDLDFINYVTSNTQESNDEKSIQASQIESLPTLKISNYTGLNQGGMELKASAEALGLNQPSYSNGSAYADLDNDGDLDLVLNNTNQEAFIYQNHADSTNGYLKVRLKGPDYNPFGVGAKVTVNGQLRENFNTRGFQSSVSNTLHFGLGGAKGPFSVNVTWPDGSLQKVQVDGNQLVVINYAEQKTKAANLISLDVQSLSFAELPFDFTHRENDFKDFDREYLIPRKYSTEGPALAIGDVNGDGKDDVYFGGAINQPGQLWVQGKNGTFKKRLTPNFDQLARAEDTDANFFDADGDGDLDLYVVSGGNEYEASQIFSFDRLFINDGQGNFQFSPGALRQIGGQGKVIAPADIDGDGDQDLFLGLNAVAGAYGTEPNHHLLINSGNANFSSQPARVTLLKDMGMISDAHWTDLDQDGDQDLLFTGEWNSIRYLENNGQGQLTEIELAGLENSEGLWYSLEIADFNNDGLLDIVAGNIGANTKLKASSDQPIRLYLGDYDDNGQADPIVFHFQEGKETPFPSRDDLIKQVSAFKKLHSNYLEYSDLDGAAELLGDLSQTKIKEVKTLLSTVFINKGNSTFEAIPLPIEAQISNTSDIVVKDINGDKKADLLLLGNDYSYRNDYGRIDAKPLTTLLGIGDGRFSHLNDKHLNTAESWGNYQKGKTITIDGKAYILSLRNDDKPTLILIN